MVYGTDGEQIGRLDPTSGVFKEYALKVEDSGPHGLVADRDGNIWFTGNFKGYIGKVDLTSDGMVWCSESGVKPNTIIQFDPQIERFARANIPSGGGTVRNMAATSDGRVYIACSGVDKVGVVEPAR